jgi:putative membrane protein
VVAVFIFAGVMATIAIFILMLVAGLQAIDHNGTRRLADVDPEDILANRFARGDIDEDEYARRLSILRYGPPLEID